jgi:hypothetical protein
MAKRTTSEMRDRPGVTVEWEPVLLVSSEGAWLGLAEHGWVVGEPGGIISGTEGDDVIGLLPVLERDPDVFFAELREALAAVHHDVDSHVARFPLERLLTTALATSSAYWSELSIGWFDHQPLSDTFRAALEDVEDARWAPQRVRQAARRRLRANRAAKGDGGT